MKKYRLSLQAEQDLLEIFLTGIQSWGIGQAEHYANELESCFNLLADHPDMGITRTDLDETPQSFTKGSHIIFYRKTGLLIEISTVLHQKMDIQSQLK